ncbi:MAG TPA: metallophosphoesterase family protein [bacterium]|nr:metallophosphoesterase family protein [bacterium]HPR88231.1 metallophosphoesterase family protein [bacterium]
MRVGIISDVHGNLEALEQVLRSIDAASCDEIVFLGDAVGYGPQPDECVAELDDRVALAILGNHDDAVLGRTNPFSFNEYALRAALWTRGIITAATRAVLERYMLAGRREGIIYVHASPANPRAWEYLFNLREAERQFAAFTEPLCFIGHSHMPGGFVRIPEGRITAFRPMRLLLNDQFRYIINVGSVGQPRDGDPRAGFVLLDQESGVVEFRRVEYAVERTQALMAERHLPEFLIQRLQHGQ